MPRARSILLLACFALAACDDGRLTLSVADAPIDSAAQVVIRFTAVIAERSDGGSERFELSPPVAVDLAALQGGLTERLIDSRQIPSGDYRAIRLEIEVSDDASDSFIRLEDGSVNAFSLSSSDESRLRVLNNFSVDRGDALAFVVDFDLRTSIHPPANAGEPFILSPSLRLVREDNVGAITGSVAPALLIEGCTPAVYAYQNANSTPDDVGSPTPPFASALLRDNLVTGLPEYRIAFLPEGEYRVALTCEAAADDPATNEDIAFVSQREASVRSGRDATANFE